VKGVEDLERIKVLEPGIFQVVRRYVLFEGNGVTPSETISVSLQKKKGGVPTFVKKKNQFEKGWEVFWVLDKGGKIVILTGGAWEEGRRFGVGRVVGLGGCF